MHTQSRKYLVTLGLSAVAMLGFAACDVEDEGSPEELGLEDSDGEELGLEDSEIEELDVVEPEEGEEYLGVSERAVGDLAASDTPVGFSFLGWHSEESIGASECPPGQVVTGFDCSGSYCDNVRLECHAYPYAWLTNVTSWSAWFEYNGKNQHVCPAGTKITGIDCWGDYCDNIAIECTMAVGLGTARCAWSNWYSEEDPSPFYAANGDAIQGIWCSGAHCDNKRFYVCET